MRRMIVAIATGVLMLGLPLSVTAAPPSPPAASQASPPAVSDQLLVGYARGATGQQRAEARSRAGATLVEVVVAPSADRAAVELVEHRGSNREEATRRFTSNPTVRYAEPNWLLTHSATSNDPYFTNGSLWGMYGDATSPANQYGTQAGEAWAAGNTGSASVYIGIIDEGYQYLHPDLDGNAGTNPGEVANNNIDDDGNGYVDDVYGWDFNANDNTIYDGTTDDHGTHVAGTIGAEGANGLGVAGMAWNVRLLSGKFLGPTGGTTANAVKAVDYFTQLKTRTTNRVNIVATNNSWGGGGFSLTLLDAISRANTANILFIAAAGNDSADNDSTTRYPSGYNVPNVIAVASITSSGSLSSFSNYGSTSVDLGAPGSAINSTLPPDTYGSYSGTSMATPHVTGAAALYAAIYPGSTAATIKAAILDSAVPTASLSGKTLTGGRLNVSGFVAPVAPSAPPIAAFSYTCSGLVCSFTDTSTGSPISWSWTFGDNGTSTAQHPSHTYSAAGPYTVTLTATNGIGSSWVQHSVAVVAPSRAVTVTVGAKKKNGTTPVTVRWTGFAGANVDVTRNGSTIVTANDGELTEIWRGSGSATYTVCETNSVSECKSAAATL